MAVFLYKGRDHQGVIHKGMVEAQSSQAVADELMQKGIVPLTIDERSQKNNLVSALFWSKLFARSISLDEKMMFCRQMHTLLKAGIPLLDSIAKIVETTRSKHLARILEQMITHISEGQSFAMALQRYPEVFSPVFTSIIDVGESSGQLDDSFLQLASYIRLEVETKKRIKKAGRYPIFVIVAVMAAMLLINFMVIPSFEQLFVNFGGELPLPTRFLMGMSKFLLNYWAYLLIAIVILFFLLRYLVKTDHGAYIWHRLKLRIPIIGGITRRIILGRFARMLAMIVRTGVPLTEGLGLVAHAAGNRYITHHLLLARDKVEHGSSLTKAISESQLFTPLVLQMLEIGEESGMIENMMGEVADFYEGEVDYDLDRLGDLIEPILLFFVGAMVLMLMLAVFLPMWGMVDFASGGK